MKNISYNLAKDLKAFGFNKPCLYGYVDYNEDFAKEYNNNIPYQLFYNLREYCDGIDYLSMFETEYSENPEFNYNVSIDEITYVYNLQSYGDQITKRTWLYESEYNSLNMDEYNKYLSDFQDGDWIPDIYSECYSAPFYAQVIDWFEEKHKIKITSEHVVSTGGWCSLIWIYDQPNSLGKWTKINIIQTFQNKYDAIENSINEAMRLIKNN